MSEQLRNIFQVTGSYCPESLLNGESPEAFLAQVRRQSDSSELPPYLHDLARAELARHQVRNNTPAPDQRNDIHVVKVNPALQLLEVAWHSLLQRLNSEQTIPGPSSEILMFWRHPKNGEERQAAATAEDLLALKVVSEKLDPVEVASANNQPVGVIDAAISHAVRKGLLLAPASKLRRNSSDFPVTDEMPERLLQAEAFTLQWHITHSCDLHCQHCYDRSDRKDVPLAQGVRILDQLRHFCLDHHVDGQVSFSGGNPFLHPEFIDLYRAAHERNLNVAILGNPVSEEQLNSVLRIARPVFFQVSLEGLEGHNDLIRGKGNFDAVLDFLDLLKTKEIYSMVMLTMTSANLDQVLPLAEILRDRVDLFTFNRLAMVGEGSNLESPGPVEYQAFVESYLQARQHNPAIALKDSLINIQLEQEKHPLFGGCTGFGCGAAFNFVSLLPDGQVHACRKFPSQIGDINRQSLEDIYYSSPALEYRRGCVECANCRLRAVCGGCLAVTYGWGHDPLKTRDPCCFLT